MRSAAKGLGAAIGLLALVALVAVAVFQLAPSGSASTTSPTLTVVGTSDVYDSNLVQSVIKPDFEQFEADHGKPVTLNYVSQGSGAAIAYAEAGTADALLVHAASLENQFVADGYSLEPYGRAIFYGDYVLLGPASDPARVTQNASHNIVQAFEDIARAGEQGQANFISRGGTPGTTVAEHKIWALATGVTLCTVSDVDGGGSSPSTEGGNCPASPSPISYPDWYHATGLSQGPNILNGDVCNYPTASGGNNCYVLTDRATFDYLASQHQLDNLHIVTRDNSSAAPGGGTLLINSFHAYALNPKAFTDTPDVSLNTSAATDLLNWLTSPAGQQAVGGYLADNGDPPFIPDAAPTITTTSSWPAHVSAGQTVSASGQVSNVVPGTPALNGVKVELMATPSSGSPSVVATTTTGPNGHFNLTYKPKATATYALVTPAITKIENTDLDPVFGDLLTPARLVLGSTSVTS